MTNADCSSSSLVIDKPVVISRDITNSPAEVFYLQAIDAENRGDKKVARRLIESAIEIGPDHPGPWYMLGVDLYGAGKFEGAAAAVGRALALMPDEPHALTNYGIYLFYAGRYDDAAVALERAVALAPTLPLGWGNLCLVSAARRDFKRAVEAGEEATRLDPSNDSARLALSFTLARSGRTADGLVFYEARFGYKLPELMRLPCPKWEGQPVSSIFVTAEQGLGDTLQFARFLPLVMERAKQVTFGCQRELCGLIKAAFPSINVLPMPVQIPVTECHTPLISIAGTLKLTEDEIFGVPADYLKRIPKQWERKVNKPVRRLWRQQLPDMSEAPFRVGLCWSGNPDQDNDRHRSASLEDFLRLAEIPGVQLYSLQVGPRSFDVKKYGGLVHDLSGTIRSFEDSADLVQQLDFVVTVCTSVVHLCGAVGTVPTAVVLPFHEAHWIWGTGNRTPWYPSVEIFRQSMIGDWRTPVAAIDRVIRGKINARQA